MLGKQTTADRAEVRFGAIVIADQKGMLPTADDLARDVGGLAASDLVAPPPLS